MNFIVKKWGEMIKEWEDKKKSNNHDWNVKYIQLDITYRCNKKCDKCNRFCNIEKLPYFKNSDMTLKQINKFIDQIKNNNITLHRIRILGGEPMLHPKLEKIIITLYKKLIKPGNLKILEIDTNGIIKKRIIAIRKLPEIKEAFNAGVIKYNISAREKDKNFYWVLSAPVDMNIKYKQCEFPYVCGCVLNKYGYWPDSACAAVAMLFNKFDYARFDFPIKFYKNWPKKELENDLCSLCASSTMKIRNCHHGKITKSYKKAIQFWLKKNKKINFKKF